MSLKPKQAMIFGAGFGKRMRPLTNDIPKPLVNVNGKPLIDYTLDKLVDYGVETVVVNTHYLHEKLEEHLSKRTDIEIKTSYEEEILETGGGLLKALPLFKKEPLFVINSDVIWIDSPEIKTLDYMAQTWNPDLMDSLLLLHDKHTAFGYDGDGDFSIRGDNKLSISPERNFVFTGVQIFNPEILDYYKNRKSFSLREIFIDKTNIERATLDGLYGIENKGKWLHIGTPESVEKATPILKNS